MTMTGRLRAWGAIASLMATAALPGAAPAQAQTAPIAIPAQPMASALSAFSRQSGLQISADGAAVAGLTSGVVTGAATPEAAMAQLLAGTGLAWRFAGPGTVVVEAPAAIAPPEGGALLDPITVTGVAGASGTHTIGAPPPPFAGGQVATGAALGLLGNREIFDTPFSQTGYTAEMIEEKQARNLADVLEADPSVRSVYSRNGSSLGFLIRGMLLDAPDIGLGGLYKLTPSRGPQMTTAYERVEVLRGPNAIATGAGSGYNGAGGSVNLVPKRATDEPITDLRASFVSEGQFGIHLDVGRRFGAENQMGARVNLEFRDGALQATDPVEAKERLGAAAVGLDYEGEATRTSFDFIYENQRMDSPTSSFSILPGVALPDAPDGDINQQQAWAYFDGETVTVLGAIEHDFIPDVLTGSAKLGYSNSSFTEFGLGAASTIFNDAGDTEGGSNYLPVNSENVSGEIGARANFDTGPINHQIALVGSGAKYTDSFFFQSIPNDGTSNIYRPVRFPRPQGDFPSDLVTGAKTDVYGVTLADTISTLDERYSLTAGFRYQQIKIENFDAETGAVASRYDESAVSPTVGALYKPTDALSIYANFAEGLSLGPTAPSNANNAGEVFPPIETTQFEAGAKYDFGDFGVTLAAFEITQPSGLLNPVTNVFGVDGEQRNRGVELGFFGEPRDGLRLLGGVTYLDGVLVKTQDGANDGNKAPGVADWNVNVGVEYDVAAVQGLSLSAFGIYTGKSALDAANTEDVPAWWRADIGAAYGFEVNQAAWEVRATIQNVTGEAYWIANNYGGVSVGAPRTYLFSVSRKL